jgi:hypothetical protein
MATSSEDELAAAEQAYRKARWTLLGHAVFMAACIALAIFLRRMFRLPPATLGVALIVALLVFGGDIMKFMRTRERIRRLYEDS